MNNFHAKEARDRVSYLITVFHGDYGRGENWVGRIKSEKSYYSNLLYNEVVDRKAQEWPREKFRRRAVKT